MGYFAPRTAETTLTCPACGQKLSINRSCKEVHMSCQACGKVYPLKDFVDQADEAMENFLENVYFDRI